MILGSNDGEGENRWNPLDRPGETFDSPKLFVPPTSSGPTGKVGKISSFIPPDKANPEPDPGDLTFGAEVLLVKPNLVGAGLEEEPPPRVSLDAGSYGLECLACRSTTSGCLAILVLLDRVTVVPAAIPFVELELLDLFSAPADSSLDVRRCCKCAYRSSSNSPIRSNKIDGARLSGV
jgi:hypothetical protein